MKLLERVASQEVSLNTLCSRNIFSGIFKKNLVESYGDKYAALHAKKKRSAKEEPTYKELAATLGYTPCPPQQDGTAPMHRHKLQSLHFIVPMILMVMMSQKQILPPQKVFLSYNNIITTNYRVYYH